MTELRSMRPTDPRPEWCAFCRTFHRRFRVVLIPAQRIAAWQCPDCHYIKGVDTPPKR